MKKIIYVSSVRLTNSVLRHYFIDSNIEKGAEVEFWDIVPLVRENYDEKNTLDVEYLQYIDNYKEFKTLIRLPENQDAVYIMLVNYQNKYIKVFRILSNHNCKMVYTYAGEMPTKKDVLKFQRITSLFLKNPYDFFKTAISLLRLKFYKILNIVKPFEIAFVVGNKSLFSGINAKKVVPINFFDFNYFKEVEFSKENIVDGKFILFIDHNAPYHSDNIDDDEEFPDAEKYFKSVNRIIGLIEESQNLKIVIAASPKAKYGSEKYEGREFYQLMTPALVKHAEYIIMPYASLAVSYVVLNYKPVLFIYNNELMRVWPFSVEEQQNLATYLNLEVYNSDLITHGKQLIFKPPSMDRYDLYKYNFLTSYESENELSSEIFWEEINKL